ncbi:MAG: biopolymer transporter ExbD [Thermoguttaceae bacterium]|nr:biopolymer transporter ExbD [Thermoguttaceae bacterium]
MKLPTPQRKPLAFNVAPLIDVTFLLIVFFVMSDRMIRDEFAMDLLLPREASGESPREDDDSDKIVLNLRSADELYYGAKRIELSQLPDRLRREKTRAGRRKISVRIRADRDVPYGAVEPILVICAQNGFPDVSFAVVNEP